MSLPASLPACEPAGLPACLSVSLFISVYFCLSLSISVFLSLSDVRVTPKGIQITKYGRGPFSKHWTKKNKGHQGCAGELKRSSGCSTMYRNMRSGRRSSAFG